MKYKYFYKGFNFVLFMKYNLFVSGHVIDSYRARVHKDELRYQRTDEELKIIIEQAFLHSQHPKKIGENTHLAVCFRDLFSDKIFGPFYHLVVSPASEEKFDRPVKKRNLVAITIKYPLMVLLGRKNYSKTHSAFS